MSDEQQGESSPTSLPTVGRDNIGRDQIHAQGSQGFINQPTGSVKQKFLNVIVNYVKSPATLYEDVRRLISGNLLVIILEIFLQVVLLMLFWRFKDQYLLSWDTYIPLSLLLVVIAVCWVIAKAIPRADHNSQVHYRKAWIVAGAIGALAWSLLLCWQGWSIWHPNRFDKGKFGIAVATFGTGSGYNAAADGYEIASRVYRKLDESIMNKDALRTIVDLKRVGTIGDDDEEVRRVGDTVGASLVIWGRLVRRGENADVYFTIVQGMDVIDNPEYPETIPISEQVLQDSITLPYAVSDNMKEVIEQQSIGISAFSLGLAQFYNRKFDDAAQYFEFARDQFTKGSSGGARLDFAKQDLGLLYYYLGRSYQMLGWYEKSQSAYETAERYDPSELAVLLGKMYNYRVFGAEKARQDTYKRILELTSSKSDIKSLYDRALAFDALNEKNAAIQTFQFLIKQEPNLYIAYLGAGRLLVQQNRLEEATDIYDRADKLVGDNRIRRIWLEYARAGAYRKAGHIQKAIEATKHAIELDTDHTVPWLYYYLAVLYNEEDRVEDAIDSYERLTEVSSVPSWSHSVFGEYLADKKRCQRAVNEFEAALRYLNDNNAPNDYSLLNARLGLAYACLSEQQEISKDHQLAEESKRQAMEAFEQAVSNVDCSGAWVHHEYARTLYEFERVGDAIEQFKLALEPSKPYCSVDLRLRINTLRNLGQIYELQGNLEVAKQTYKQVTALCAKRELADDLSQVDIDVLLFVMQRLKELGVETTDCSSLFRG